MDDEVELSANRSLFAEIGRFDKKPLVEHFIFSLFTEFGRDKLGRESIS